MDGYMLCYSWVPKELETVRQERGTVDDQIHCLRNLMIFKMSCILKYIWAE